MNDPRIDLAKRILALPADKRRTFLAALTQSGRTVSELPVPVTDRSGPLRLSGLSSYFWLLDGFGVGGLTHVAGGLRFSGGVDVARLAAALAQVVARQEALRLRFVPLADGGLAATARSPEEGFAGLRQMDFAAMPAQVAAARLDHFSAQDAGDALDLQDGPGWRATLVHLPGDEQVLLLTLHHIMCDGWSMGVLQADLLAALAGQLDPTPLAPSYLDVQHWQAALAEADAGSDDLGWWQDRLGHAGPPPLELPTDRPRPAQRSWRGGRVTLDIPAPLADRLRLLATAQGATLQQVLMAGWAALLHRLSGAEDLCIGLPVAGRDRAVQQQMVGLFVNTLPLPVHPDPQAGFAALLDQLRDSAGHALQHQNVALDALTRALRGDEAQAARPLFDVVHAHQPGGFAPVTLPGGQTVTPFARATGAQQFDLALETVEAASGPISTALGYDADLFLEDTATRWLQAYRDLLDAAAADPAQPLDLLPLMPPAAQAQLTAPWPDSQVQATVLVPAQIAAQDPARTAIVFAGTETSYGQLNAQANQVAQALLARGIAREDRIAICLPRGPAAIAACLGVLRAGGAFVPLDPGHPADRRAHIITDCGAALVIGEGPAERPALTSAEIAQASQTPPDLTLHPDQLAYVIYTSGSTGTPKGVAVSHGPLAMHVASTAAAYEMGPACRELHMLSLAFDGAHERWMVPFWLGGAIVLRPDTLWSGQDALDVMAAQQVTNAGFPTALLQQVAEAAQGQTPPPVQMYSFGGEAMPGAGYDLARQTLRPDLMINGYGPTECVISPMIWKGRAGDSCATPHLPIGRPVGARRAYVLDDRLRPVLPGMPGTLYLSGGLARGYLGRPGQTAAAFLPDPFGAPGDRMYCTGDRVRQRPDGVIDYLGRADRQIKLRGYRIEPGEIEARLGACEEVARAHVAKVDTDTGPLLAGWITPAQGAHPDETTLQNHLRRDLPGYMIPAQIEIINSFPQTPNGKTDTAALKLTERNSPQTTTETLTPTETKIATIWENITQQKPNKNTNFFNQNNDSIKAMRLVDALRKAFPDRQLTVADMFNDPTPAGLARCLEQDDHGSLSVVNLHNGSGGAPVFLFPGLMVNTREYAPLARHLQTNGQGDHPITGFVCYSLNENRRNGLSIKTLAADYAQYIKDNAQGPCSFLGWSWGGVLAYETAQLLQSDIDLNFVGMLDVCNLDVNFATKTLVEIKPVQEKALTKLVADWMPRTKLRPKWEALFRKMDADVYRQFLRFVQATAGQLPTDGPGIGSKEYELWTFLDNTLIYRKHQTQPADIPIHVWQAEDSIRRQLSLVDWTRYSNRVERTVVIPDVTHREIVDSTAFHQSFADSLSGLWKEKDHA
ncbi:non-ribosomal peptide synthetase [Loktanella agnita]|uniref:non-ribosomal peptide synthetase n=1 Tax=Loktanella agnita TaxID=287097 RepID=UPI0039858E1A